MIKDALAVYAGSQVQAAGALIHALDTGRWLVVKRSKQVDDGNCWCSVGGKIVRGESAKQAARREIGEEIGYWGEMRLYPALVYEESWLRFYNHIGVVDKEFVPQLNWESQSHQWIQDLEKVPKPVHFGLKALLADSKSQRLIERVRAKSTEYSAT